MTHEASTNTLTAEVIHLTTRGEQGIFGVVRDRSGFNYFFDVRQLQHYKGQTIREIGLFPGIEVQIDVGLDGIMRQMRFPFRDQYRQILGLKLPFQDLLDSLRFS